MYKNIVSGIMASAVLVSVMPSQAAELLINPREYAVRLLIQGQSPTIVIADNVNVRTYPTLGGSLNITFARLNKGDNVYVLSCEGISSGHAWVKVYIPDIQESGYVAAEFLQNNFNYICERTR